MKALFLVLWPSFLVAGMAEIAFFTFIDPQDLYLLGQPIHLPPVATYSIGFLGFWAVSLASSYATCFFQRTAQSLNQLSDHQRCQG